MDDEGSDRRSSDDTDEPAEDASEAVDESESDGSGDEDPSEPEDAPTDEDPSGPDDADEGAYELEDGPTDEVGDLSPSPEADPDPDPAAAADEAVSDGPYGDDVADDADADTDDVAADTDPADDADDRIVTDDAAERSLEDEAVSPVPEDDDEADETETPEPAPEREPVSQSDLEPAGDPEAQWGPADDEEWEDPFPDVETEVPDYDADDEAAEAYPANPNTPDSSVETEDVVGGATGQPESDGGYADPTSTTTVENDFGDGPASDQEMPLADHIEEMVRRLGVVIIVMAVVSAIVFPFAERIINFLWFSYLPGQLSQCPANPNIANGGAACARVYNPLALIFARLKMATLAGLVVSLPVFVYETYLFMRPGLYPKERRYYLASVPTSLILAAAGIAFAHLLVLPAIFTYFVFYSQDATVIAFGLTETFDLMVLMLGGFAIIFQIPLFVSLALMMGLVTRRWMATKRLYFWGAFAGLAFLFSPDPTGMAPIIVAATMIVLFEGTLLLAKWTGRE
ncbi:twin-arginine translocase subunit TatC [Haloglomus halophilum]|uniref:twin-arginine translocase subunit TatC n=1 Tax=Haloglomus halophilum TaxID=2962672 RepID=UPI0020CA1696|nr:twin-arginine translocase subunit TatC [Haloglomus halophilum]